MLNGEKQMGSHYLTWIVDGSEQSIVSPCDSVKNTRFYSVKKGKCTVNILIIINIQTKQILYLSPSYPGSINDGEIIHKTVNEWHVNFEDDEYGLGDSGFNGFNDIGVRIVTPIGERER